MHDPDRRNLLVCAANEAMSADKSSTIIAALLHHLRDHRIILPAPASIERIGLAGRARARRLTADAMIVDLGAARVARLDELLVKDPVLKRTRIPWLCDWAKAPTASNLMAILDQLAYLRAIERAEGRRRSAHQGM